MSATCQVTTETTVYPKGMENMRPLRRFLVGSLFVVTVGVLIALALNTNGIHVPVSAYAFLPK